MARERPYVQRSSPERIAAWLLTGPVGHLVAFAVDVSAAWVGWARGRAFRRRGGRRA